MSSRMIKIRVQDFYENPDEVFVPADASTAMLFDAVSAKRCNGIEPEYFQIAFRGLLLEYDETKRLSDYHLKDSSTVTMMQYKSDNQNWLMAIMEKKKRTLRPLKGFIEITSEPDMITFDDDPNTRRAKMPCGHVIGTESMTDYCNDILRSGNYRFSCPDPDCKMEWDYFLVRHVACFTPNQLHEIEKKLSVNYLNKDNGVQKCPGCQTWCFRATGTGVCVSCPVCTKKTRRSYDFCWVCLRKWRDHAESDTCGNPECDGRDHRLKVLATCETKEIDMCEECPSVRGCPKCGLLIMHKENCAHMNCTNCKGYGFCFICLQELKDGKWQCNPWMGTCQLAPRQTTLPGTSSEINRL